jgi:hypothetical protein
LQGQTARALLLAQLDSACTPPAERQLSAAVAFAAFAACFATLVFSAEARGAFGLEAAAAAQAAHSTATDTNAANGRYSGRTSAACAVTGNVPTFVPGAWR